MIRVAAGRSGAGFREDGLTAAGTRDLWAGDLIRARTWAAGLNRALAQANVCIVHKDWPQSRDLTAEDFREMRREVVIDGRRILRREAMKGVELTVLGG